MKKKKLAWLTAPFGLWMIIFTVIPLAIVVYYAFTANRTGEFTFDNIIKMQSFWHTMIDSIAFGAIATVLCLLLGYPLAYSISRAKGVKQKTMVMLIMLPQWMNFLLRTYAWMSLLENTGLINRFLGIFGIGPIQMINTDGAIVLGMVYNFLPFMVLPLYSVMTKIDKSVLEAAQDLGANGVHVFGRVILPLSVPGIITGVTMVFVPSVSTFIISQLLGGGRRTLIGDLIEMYFLGTGGSPNYGVGSALSLVLMLLIVICMAVMNRFGDEEGTGAIMV